jgi:SAM-dependent methyltransferase
MNFIEKFLLYLSRAPQDTDYSLEKNEWSLDTALSLLESEYPNFSALVSGKRVADFGCGMGYQSIALVKKYNCSVVGIESNTKILEKAMNLAQTFNIPKGRLAFVPKVSIKNLKTMDLVISQNSFEHFCDPLSTLEEMKQLLAGSGKLLITFGPPWFSPYGSHMHFFCKVPWINILFSEQIVMNVRSRFRNDGAIKYEQVESGLNKMSIKKFERVIDSSGMKIECKRYTCIKKLNLFSKIPFLRELFINHVSAILAMDP